MKRVQSSIWIFVGIMCLSFSTSIGQQGSISPVAAKLNGLRSNGSFAEFDIFTRATDPGPRDAYREFISSYDYFNWNSGETKTLLAEKPDLLRIALPGDDALILELYRTDIFASGYQVRTSMGARVEHADMVFYHGQIAGKAKSLAAISVLPDEIRIMYSDNSGSYRVQQTDGNRYICFKEKDQLKIESKECFVDDSHVLLSGEEGKIRSQYRTTGGCVEIYFECDRESYLDNNSSVAATEAWVAALFNEVSILYENEMIPISISEIFVWTTTDPYASLTSTSALLNEFVSQVSTNGYNGRLAHLLSTRSLGGGIAYVGVLCSSSLQCAVSASLSTNIVPFPNYSWNVNVVAHETGHNFGSRHTHRCVWNGNNTQIDDCGSVWGSSEGSVCYDANNPILPSAGGTVMSYCHLINGVGINYSNGFGPQPGDVLRNNFNSASCNTGDCSTPNCTTLSDPVNGQNNVSVSTAINWTSLAAASGYKITAGTSPGATNIANNIDVGGVASFNPGGLPFGSQIYVRITPYNALGNASSCQQESFQTESNVQPSCTQLSFPTNGATDVAPSVELVWNDAPGNQTGYLINIGLTSGGGEIANNIDVGNVTSYNPGSFPSESVIYVRITPYGSQGTVTGCPISSFTTLAALGGDDCSVALGISCGATVQGSTLEALDDNVPFCGTSNTTAGVWYKFIGDGSNVTISTCGAADYDTKLSVYRGSCAQLICVGGNDDWEGCNYGSQVSFASIQGRQYFILVHGWDDRVGDFNLTLACVDAPYCPSQGIIADLEWISDFTFGSFSNSSGASHYSDFTNQIIEVVPGESYGVSATPEFGQGSSNEYFRIWIDYNSDGDFDDAGEKILELGPSTSTVSSTITIPSTAVSGDRLLRVAMKYNAFSDPCDVFPYGEVEEYTLRVRCDVVANTNDSGGGSLREALSCVGVGDIVYFSDALQGQTITLTSVPISINRDVSILADPTIDISISGVSVSKVFQVLGGNIVMMHGLNIVGGTSSLGNGIDNAGNLILRDMSLSQHAGNSGATLLHNQGQVTLEGNCDIKDP